MPIADIPEYGTGHFARVYKHLIIPACEKAGFLASRADETKGSNLIILDILQQIYNADIVICDLSAKNPNVMYELGIRQAFELPTLLIKDKITTRIFDISGLRDVEYDHELRIDTVELSIDALAESLKSTYEAYKNGDKKDINSIVSLLGISPAKVRQTEISQDTSLILDSLNQLHSRINAIEVGKTEGKKRIPGFLLNDEIYKKSLISLFKIGDVIKTNEGLQGEIKDIGNGLAAVKMNDGSMEIINLDLLKNVAFKLDAG